MTWRRGLSHHRSRGLCVHVSDWGGRSPGRGITIRKVSSWKGMWGQEGTKSKKPGSRVGQQGWKMVCTGVRGEAGGPCRSMGPSQPHWWVSVLRSPSRPPGLESGRLKGDLLKSFSFQGWYLYIQRSYTCKQGNNSKVEVLPLPPPQPQRRPVLVGNINKTQDRGSTVPPLKMCTDPAELPISPRYRKKVRRKNSVLKLWLSCEDNVVLRQSEQCPHRRHRGLHRAALAQREQHEKKETNSRANVQTHYQLH